MYRGTSRRLRCHMQCHPTDDMRLTESSQTQQLYMAVQPGRHLLLNNLNMVDPKTYGHHPSTLYFLDSRGSQQSKERIITGAGLAQPGKSYRAVRTAEISWRTSENPYVIAPIEAPLKSAAWRSKFVIFHNCATFFWNFLVALCRFWVPRPLPRCLIWRYPDTYLWNYSRSRIWVLNYNNHRSIHIY
jgi:hypothetical protein